MQILKRIKEAYSFETDAEVADFLDINPSTLSMQKNRGRLNLKRIIDKCSDLNRNWLLDGEGKMRKEDSAENGNRIPIYSTLTVKNHTLDLQKSIKAGKLFADITDELQHFSASDQVIGYVISRDTRIPSLKKDDIAIINLDSHTEEGGIFLVSSKSEITFKKVENEIRTNLSNNKGNGYSSVMDFQSNYSRYNLIGRLIWIMRRL